MPARILLVDDFEPWRSFVCSIIQTESELRIICEVSDGLAAVEKANKLKPDLILMDIGLPKLNGIAAAREIHNVAPKSKILFLSLESSPDAVQEALRFGVGFVVKTDAPRELLPVIRAVIGEGRFVSSRLMSQASSWDTLVFAGVQ